MLWLGGVHNGCSFFPEMFLASKDKLFPLIAKMQLEVLLGLGYQSQVSKESSIRNLSSSGHGDRGGGGRKN